MQLLQKQVIAKTLELGVDPEFWKDDLRDPRYYRDKLKDEQPNHHHNSEFKGICHHLGKYY